VAGEVRRDLLDAVRAAGLLEPPRLAALLAGDGVPPGGGAPETGATGAEGRSRTAVVSLPGGPRLLLRPLRHGGVLAPLTRDLYLGLGRPRRELAVSERLRAAGAAVPAPALALGLRGPGPCWRLVLGTELEEGAEDAVAFLARRPARARLLAAAGAAGRAVRRFHDAGGAHPDLHVKNLLVREGPGGAPPCEVLVIDLDRARIEAVRPARARMAELMRLLRSLVKRDLLTQVGVRGCVRFFSAYVGGDRALRRALLAHRAREERRIARHARLWPTPPPRQ